MKDCAAKYTEIDALATELIKEIETLPAGLNTVASSKATALNQYAKQRTLSAITIDFDVKDKQSRFTYSEVLSFIELYRSKKTEIEIIKAGLIKQVSKKDEENKDEKNTKKTYTTKRPKNLLQVSEYKTWLTQELQKIAGANDTDEIKIED